MGNALVGVTEDVPADLSPDVQWDWQYTQAFIIDNHDEIQKVKKVLVVTLIGGMASVALLGLLAFR